MKRRQFVELTGVTAFTLAAAPVLARTGMPSCALNDVFSTARDLQAAASAPGSVRPLARRALIVDDEIADPSVYGQAIRRLVGELENRQIEPLISTDAADAAARFGSDPGIDAILIDWNLDGQHASTRGLIERVRALYPELPVFLLSDEESALAIPSEVMSSVDGFIRVLEDTPGFIGGRIQVAMERYRSDMLPPMFKALLEFSQTYSYSWHTPGHTGGTAFLRSPAGRAFHAFFGEALLRADLSTSVEALGSLLEHSGAIGEGERHAARVFGAHRTYFVTNGSSTSNRVILMASVTRDQVVLCDRNCHKSIEQAVTLTGARPTYLMPTRNGYGIIGPIPPSRLQPEAIRRDVANNSLSASTPDQIPVHAVITNSTYDGLCYKVSRIEALLGDVVDRLHFDEAWYGYARFNPLYRERFAMHGDAARHGADQPTVFATQSTHKLLAALSQASMIHIRDGRRPIPHARFNEAYMMHASTSPLYPMIASLDISAAMMAGPGGTELTDIAIREAVAFRCALARRHAEHRAKDDWFFAPWQPETFTDSETGRRLVFHEAPPERLATDPGAWVLAPGDTWHGFEGLEDDYCMLDPIKVSILTPGASPGGGLADHGIPAILVSAYLVERGIVAEKTADFTILFLFSLGITEGKWGTLINAFYEFKRDYDRNTPVSRALPRLADQCGGTYMDMGLRDLGDALFAAMRELQTTSLMAQAFSGLPVPVMTPAQAYEHLVQDRVELVALAEMPGRIAATGVAPYPPGIPLLMPGENAGPGDGAVLGYLRALETFDRRFSGFEHDIHGVDVDAGRYHILCLRKGLG